jgi:nucleotide-binding universal stress UspA family protein
MIVVGVDGSEHAAKALRWALDEARLRDTDVLAVYAWTMPAPPGHMGFYAEPLQDPAIYQEGAERMLEGILDETAPETGGVRLDRRAVQGSPADELVRAAADAELLVVGSRGHGGFSSLLLGSVSQQCVQHATCPVVVVRDGP